MASVDATRSCTLTLTLCRGPLSFSWSSRSLSHKILSFFDRNRSSSDSKKSQVHVLVRKVQKICGADIGDMKQPRTRNWTVNVAIRNREPRKQLRPNLWSFHDAGIAGAVTSPALASWQGASAGCFPSRRFLTLATLGSNPKSLYSNPELSRSSYIFPITNCTPFIPRTGLHHAAVPMPPPRRPAHE